MRFARLRSNNEAGEPPSLASVDRLIFLAYNAIWWVPVVLAILGILSFWVGSVSFVVISVVRALINAYRNNAMSIESAQRFPLRSP